MSNCAKQSYNFTVECFETIKTQDIDNKECNSILLSDINHFDCYGITAIFISIFNKTKNDFELSALSHCSIIVDDHVYLVLDQQKIAHYQMLACNNLGQHIIIPFSSNILQVDYKQRFTGYFNMTHINKPICIIEIKQDHADEYEVRIRCSKLVNLVWDQGYCTIKKQQEI